MKFMHLMHGESHVLMVDLINEFETGWGVASSPSLSTFVYDSIFHQKNKFCDFSEVYASFWTIWSEVYMADILAVSNSEVKFEVLMAQPLPKLATATREGHKGVTSYTWDITPYFPPTEFKYYHEK